MCPQRCVRPTGLWVEYGRVLENYTRVICLTKTSLVSPLEGSIIHLCPLPANHKKKNLLLLRE